MEWKNKVLRTEITWGGERRNKQGVKDSYNVQAENLDEGKLDFSRLAETYECVMCRQTQVI
jgi:hypothetical protein